MELEEVWMRKSLKLF